ncbi:phosphate ABC transporter substrate-binding protein, PhoT family [Sphingomonas palmae]|uniref:Phosphate ABC transporter substrate-binding protein, PhoT family n=1 Tax=Sphingomonas palmae TaxID=1855283 RepID=A0A1H7TYU3_9SPHN|nr:substrate-binding domain-containing protein [Sphingomonas palmae]SEL90052.1 phosphate ABC transporter substrate-binding protein, PhoT family [Sphingomonas palmae]
MRRLVLALAAVLPVALGACVDQAAGGGAGARDQIRVVGSSTVYPFTTLVAEQYLAANPDARPPVIESTGTGAGIRLFCSGIGASYPDLVDASRRMKRREYDECASHGAGDLMEVQIGIDGIALAEARRRPPMQLTPALLFRALAAAPGGRPNRSRTWRDLDPALPATPIRVYGPPATSGTRDAFAELILARGCEALDPRLATMRERDRPAFDARCLRVRDDGAFIDAGENDNLIVQKLRANPDALGIFGYSYLEENSDAVRGIAISGVAPTYQAIADGRYPGARPLYVYVKRSHLRAVPGLRRFLALYAANWAPGGALTRRGLIPSAASVRARAADTIMHDRALDLRTLD